MLQASIADVRSLTVSNMLAHFLGQGLIADVFKKNADATVRKGDTL
jgi:hypothetical protein